MNTTFKFKNDFYKQGVYLYEGNDVIANHVLRYGIWEYKICQIMKQFYTENTDVLDIGANIGLSSINLCTATNVNGIVHMFEPQFQNFQLLDLNTRHMSNRRLYNICLSDKSKIVNFDNSSSDNMGGCKVVDNSNEFNLCTINLDSIKFDNKISIIKIDVEGHEDYVIKGGLNTIKQNMPVIIFELWDSLKEETEVFKILEELGYVCSRIEQGMSDYVAIPRFLINTI
jgi:FkbM family methyltransferase